MRRDCQKGLSISSSNSSTDTSLSSMVVPSTPNYPSIAVVGFCQWGIHTSLRWYWKFRQLRIQSRCSQTILENRTVPQFHYHGSAQRLCRSRSDFQNSKLLINAHPMFSSDSSSAFETLMFAYRRRLSITNAEAGNWNCKVGGHEKRHCTPFQWTENDA